MDLIRILCSQFFTQIDWKDVVLACPKLAFCNVIGKSSHVVNSVESVFLGRYLIVSVFPLISLPAYIYYEQQRVRRSCWTRQFFYSDTHFCDSWLCVSGSVNRVGMVVGSVPGTFQCFCLPIFRSSIDSSLFKCERWVANDCASQKKSRILKKKMPALH